MVNSIYNLIGGVARIAIAILSVPLMVRALGTISFGIYSIVNSFLAFATLAEMSVVTVTTVFVAKVAEKNNDNIIYREVVRSCFWVTTSLAIIFSILLIVSSPYISLLFTNSDKNQIAQFENLLNIGAFLVFFRTIQQFFNGLEQAHGHYSILNKINSLFYLLVFGGSVVIAILSKQLNYVYLWQCIVSVCFLIVHYNYCCSKGLIINLWDIITWPNEQIKPVLTYCIKVWPGTLGGLLFTQGDKIIVGKLIGLESAGLYTAFTSTVNQINSVSALPVQPLITSVSSNYINQNTNEKSYNLNSLITKSTALSSLIATGGGLLLIFLAPEVCQFLFGKTHENVIDLPYLLTLLATIYSTYSLNAAGYYILFAVGKEFINTTISLIVSVLTIGLIYLLTINFGLKGAIIGNVGFWGTLSYLYIAYSIIRVDKPFIIKAYLVPVIMLLSAFVLTLKNNNIWLRLIFLNLFYVVLLFALWPYLRTLIIASFLKLRKKLINI